MVCPYEMDHFNVSIRIQRIKWNTEIRTSSDFGLSTLVRFEIILDFEGPLKPEQFCSDFGRST